jgi:hypothetical protein
VQYLQRNSRRIPNLPKTKQQEIPGEIRGAHILDLTKKRFASCSIASELMLIVAFERSLLIFF